MDTSVSTDVTAAVPTLGGVVLVRSPRATWVGTYVSLQPLVVRDRQAEPVVLGSNDQQLETLSPDQLERFRTDLVPMVERLLPADFELTVDREPYDRVRILALLAQPLPLLETLPQSYDTLVESAYQLYSSDEQWSEEQWLLFFYALFGLPV